MTTWTCATHGPVPADQIRHLDHNSPTGQERHECGSSAGLDWTKTKEHEMSADNWTTCPRCFRRHAAKLQAMREDVAAKYGQIPIAEFDKLRVELAKAETAQFPQTLREDYEFYGAEDGTVTAEYGCSCRECGLETSFTHQHDLPVDAAS